MLRSLTKAIPPNSALSILKAENLFQQQCRTTFILKRRNPPRLHKKGEKPKPLKNRFYIYDLMEFQDIKLQPDLQVILTSYVAGLGNIGDKVSVRPHFAYENLLLPGLAVYATPENVEKYKKYERSIDDVLYSSKDAQFTVGCLSNAYISVVMNRDNPWTIKPWHIKVSFRKCGYEVPEEAITLPPKEISGPNIDFEEKEFYVTVTINNKEKVNVRCTLHHWSTELTERIPHVHEFWKKPKEPIYPEFAPILAQIPSRAEQVEIEEQQ